MTAYCGHDHARCQHVTVHARGYQMRAPTPCTEPGINILTAGNGKPFPASFVICASGEHPILYCDRHVAQHARDYRGSTWRSFPCGVVPLAVAS